MNDTTDDPAVAVAADANDTVEPPLETSPGVAEGAETPPALEAASAAEDPPAAAGEPVAPPARPARAARKPRDPAMARAFRTGRPIRGTVTAVIKGGFEIRIGRHRGFCPFSQMDIARVEDPEPYQGQDLMFRVIQFRRGGDDVVLSRRALLEEEREDEAKAVRATLIRGALRRGRIVSLTDFGAFVDLGAGVTGLVHTSELSHARVREPGDAVQIGQVVDVKILKLDESRGRVSLSIRQAEADPWEGVADAFKPGQTYPGTISRIEDFGAFVELGKGVEALLHPRDLPPRPGGWVDEFAPGQQRSWRVQSVDPRRRRISVVPEEVDVQPVEIIEGATLTGKVQRAERFGVLVWLGPGRIGLIPSIHTGTSRGSNLSEKFAEGQDVEVDVLEIAEQGRRIRLTVHGVAPAEPAPRKPRGPKPPPPPQDTAQFSNDLGDLLKAALGPQSPPSDETPSDES